jgi:broad specificity phosphatase PhoE
MGRQGNREDRPGAQMSGVLPQVYLVRHGETAWTISRQATGRADIPLTERGEHAAQELSARLQGLSFAKVFTSPLQRARRTGELAGFGERMEPDADLMEWDYGAYEGRRTLDIRAEHPGWRLFEDGCPGGETLLEVGMCVFRGKLDTHSTANRPPGPAQTGQQFRFKLDSLKRPERA